MAMKSVKQAIPDKDGTTFVYDDGTSEHIKGITASLSKPQEMNEDGSENDEELMEKYFSKKKAD